MALYLDKASPTVWQIRSDNTRVLEINGTNIIIGSGATVKVDNLALGQSGSALTKLVGSPTAGLRIAAGVLTTVSEADTVVTGLATVVACVATWQTDPADATYMVSATIGNQAGAPAAGSIIVKTWKSDGSDPTPAAADSFTKAVNWIAIGT